MKGKSLYVFAIASLFSLNSFGLEITKGHLINHKEWTTGDLKVTYKNSDRSWKQNQLGLKQNQPNISSVVRTLIEPQFGTTNTVTPIIAHHYAEIKNNLKTAQSYTYIFASCVNFTETTQQCSFRLDTFQLEPEGIATTNIDPELQVIFNKAGDYSIATSSSLRSDVLAPNFYDFNQEAYSYNTITITDGSHMKG